MSARLQGMYCAKLWVFVELLASTFVVWAHVAGVSAGRCGPRAGSRPLFVTH